MGKVWHNHHGSPCLTESYHHSAKGREVVAGFTFSLMLYCMGPAYDSSIAEELRIGDFRLCLSYFDLYVDVMSDETA